MCAHAIANGGVGGRRRDAVNLRGRSSQKLVSVCPKGPERFRHLIYIRGVFDAPVVTYNRIYQAFSKSCLTFGSAIALPSADSSSISASAAVLMTVCSIRSESNA